MKSSDVLSALGNTDGSDLFLTAGRDSSMVAAYGLLIALTSSLLGMPVTSRMRSSWLIVDEPGKIGFTSGHVGGGQDRTGASVGLLDGTQETLQRVRVAISWSEAADDRRQVAHKAVNVLSDVSRTSGGSAAKRNPVPVPPMQDWAAVAAAGWRAKRSRELHEHKGSEDTGPAS